MKRLRGHWKIFNAIFKKTVSLVDKAIKSGARVAIEWPSGCAYWRWPCVDKMIRKCSLKKARCNGCAMGLTGGPKNLPIYKPWTIATNDECLWYDINKNKNRIASHGTRGSTFFFTLTNFKFIHSGAVIPPGPRLPGGT